MPYVEQPEQIVPGKALFFATALATDGFALGVLVESQMGRPTKIEGNPDHPASLGATDAFAQAAILDFYDPDRSQVVTKEGRVETWVHFQEMLLGLREKKREAKGAGLSILTRTVTSPTLADQLRRLREQFPQLKVHAYEPITREAVVAGTKLAFGEELEPVYHLEKADVIVALDADFFSTGPGRLKDARAFASRREVEPDVRAFIGGPAEPAGQAPAMNRLYAIECTPTITGASADHRLAVSARDVDPIARVIARGVGVGEGQGGGPPAELPGHLARHANWVAALCATSSGRRGDAWSSPARGRRPRSTRWRTGSTTRWATSARRSSTCPGSMARGPARHPGRWPSWPTTSPPAGFDSLIMLGVNPVYDAPSNLNFAELLGAGRVPLTVHLGSHQDETAGLCHWHIPESHALESWGDVRSFDGTATIQQPLIAPLYASKSAIELLAVLLGEPDRSGLEMVRDYWRRQSLPGDFEAVWKAALRKGVIEGTAHKAREVKPASDPIPARGQAASARGWSWSSAPIRRSGTAGSPTTAGSRNCPSR